MTSAIEKGHPGVAGFHVLLRALSGHDRRFSRTCAVEAEEPVKRLRDRACLALWCGNNEIEWRLVRQGLQEPDRSRRLRHDYKTDLSSKCCRRPWTRRDPMRTYWPSSPCGERRGTLPDDWSPAPRRHALLGRLARGTSPSSDYETVQPRFCPSSVSSRSRPWRQSAACASGTGSRTSRRYGDEEPPAASAAETASSSRISFSHATSAMPPRSSRTSST